jgi:hypothetical protein
MSNGRCRVTHLADAGAVQTRLEEIERDLASRENALEAAALAWFRGKREREKSRAEAFLQATGTVAERNAKADEQTALYASECEASFEAQKAVVRVLETRANIGMSLLRSQGRAT